MAVRRFAAALFASFAVVVLGAPGVHAQQVVTPGAFCSPEGATGVTSAGTPMVCTTTATDSRARWRAAGVASTTTTLAATSAPAAPSEPVGLVQPLLETGCHPAYSGACVPDVGPGSDVDCFRSANGPTYVDARNFRVDVITDDPYGLDADNDGIACEDDGSDLAAATGGGDVRAQGQPAARTGASRSLVRTGADTGRMAGIALSLVGMGVAVLVLGVDLVRQRPRIE